MYFHTDLNLKVKHAMVRVLHETHRGYHLPHVAPQSNNHNHDNHSAPPRVKHNKRCWYSPLGGKPGYTREEVVRLVTAGANLPGGCPIDCWPLCSLCTVQYFCQTADSGHKSAIPVSYFIWPNNDCKQRIRTKTAAAGPVSRRSVAAVAVWRVSGD